jgi:hypothetical protein
MAGYLWRHRLEDCPRRFVVCQQIPDVGPSCLDNAPEPVEPQLTGSTQVGAIAEKLLAVRIVRPRPFGMCLLRTSLLVGLWLFKAVQRCGPISGFLPAWTHHHHNKSSPCRRRTAENRTLPVPLKMVFLRSVFRRPRHPPAGYFVLLVNSKERHSALLPSSAQTIARQSFLALKVTLSAHKGRVSIKSGFQRFFACRRCAIVP